MNRWIVFLSMLILVACGRNGTDAPAPAAPAASAAPASAAPAAPAPATPAAAPTAAPATPLAAADEIGFATVAAARAAITSRKDVEGREDDGWLIVADKAAFAFWSFTPTDNAAYPAVVKRTIHDEGGTVSVAMAILCEAPQTACDELRHQFDDINGRMRTELQRQADTQKKKSGP